MALHPWHPRLVPFAVYGIFLAPIGLARTWIPVAYPFVYVVQCGLVVWLLWRYRKLLPELTLTFDWLAVPVAVIVFVAWVGLGWLVDGDFAVRWHALLAGAPPTPSPEDFRTPHLMGPVLGWIAIVLRLLGMSLVVPLFEELFDRSLILRSLSHWRQTAIGVVQMAQDLPLIGDWLIHTDLARRASRHAPTFGPQFLSTPLGRLTGFGVLTSTTVFMFSHVNRDKPAAVFCGLSFCLLLAATRKKGLGPVIWAHGITNALLMVYTLHTGDWQFL